MTANYLEPSEILGEILFGLIMVLTFTLGAGLVVRESEDAVREMLVAVVSCNLAWGLIDASMYIMTSLFDRSRDLRLWSAVKKTADDEQALSLIGEWLEPQLAGVTSAAARTRLSEDMLARLRSTEPEAARVTRADLLGAAASFWLVFLSVIPAIAPFLILDSRHLALRVSNGLLLALLFLVGYRWAQFTNWRPWITGLAMLAAGGVLVAVAIALGG
jgi:hypothetical protein